VLAAACFSHLSVVIHVLSVMTWSLTGSARPNSAQITAGFLLGGFGFHGTLVSSHNLRNSSRAVAVGGTTPHPIGRVQRCFAISGWIYASTPQLHRLPQHLHLVTEPVPSEPPQRCG